MRKDGSRFQALVMIKALHAKNGRLRGFAKVTRDMTGRRKREEKLRKSEQRSRRPFEESRDAVLPPPRGTSWTRMGQRRTSPATRRRSFSPLMPVACMRTPRSGDDAFFRGS